MNLGVEPLAIAKPVLDHLQAASPQMQPLADAFSRLMVDDPNADIFNRSRDPLGSTVATQFAQKHDQAMRHVMHDIQSLMVDSRHLTIPEMVSRSMALSVEIATAEMQFTAACTFSRGTKSGVQNLMKNQ